MKTLHGEVARLSKESQTTQRILRRFSDHLKRSASLFFDRLHASDRVVSAPGESRGPRVDNEGAENAHKDHTTTSTQNIPRGEQGAEGPGVILRGDGIKVDEQLDQIKAAGKPRNWEEMRQASQAGKAAFRKEVEHPLLSLLEGRRKKTPSTLKSASVVESAESDGCRMEVDAEVSFSARIPLSHE